MPSFCPSCGEELNVNTVENVSMHLKWSHKLADSALVIAHYMFSTEKAFLEASVILREFDRRQQEIDELSNDNSSMLGKIITKNLQIQNLEEKNRQKTEESASLCNSNKSKDPIHKPINTCDSKKRKRNSRKKYLQKKKTIFAKILDGSINNNEQQTITSSQPKVITKKLKSILEKEKFVSPENHAEETKDKCAIDVKTDHHSNVTSESENIRNMVEFCSSKEDLSACFLKFLESLRSMIIEERCAFQRFLKEIFDKISVMKGKLKQIKEKCIQLKKSDHSEIEEQRKYSCKVDLN